MPLDRGAERLLQMLSASGAGARPTRSVEARRRMLAELASLADEAPATTVDTRDLILPGPGGPLRIRRYVAPSASAGGLVYLHGGGWVAGGLDTHDGLCRSLAARSGVQVLAIDYRLAPEHPFPAAVEDALAAACWTAAHAAELGIDPRRLGVAGDSVGAGLAAVVAQSRNAPPLALQVLLCPVLDLVNETPSRRAYARGYFIEPETVAEDLRDYCEGKADLSDPRLSPLLTPSLIPQPPALIHAAEYDPFRDEAEAYARRLKASGTAVRYVAWPGLIHYFYCLARAIPGAVRAIEALGDEIGAALA
jgi:acetyl esterase/lipase